MQSRPHARPVVGLGLAIGRDAGNASEVPLSEEEPAMRARSALSQPMMQESHRDSSPWSRVGKGGQ